MNVKNPNGLVCYRTPTSISNNPARLLSTHSKMSKGQAAIVRAQLCEMNDGNKEPQWEDIQERLNRNERRTVESEARAHRKELARRDARRKIRADKRAKRELVSL